MIFTNIIILGVCSERNWQLGTVCGYQIGLERRVSEDTRLVYVTNALFKQKFIGKNEFVNNYTHVILDEIHDRDIDTDFVLLLIKMSLRRDFKGKLVLMSATLDPVLLQKYFAKESINPRIPLVRSNIKMFNVEVR